MGQDQYQWVRKSTSESGPVPVSQEPLKFGGWMRSLDAPPNAKCSARGVSGNGRVHQVAMRDGTCKVLGGAARDRRRVPPLKGKFVAKLVWEPLRATCACVCVCV